MLTILRDAGLSRLIESEALEKLAGGFQFTEGPLWCRDGSLLFQDIKAERTYRLGPGGQLERCASTPARPTARLSPRTARSSSASRTAGGSHAWTRTVKTCKRSSRPGRASGSTVPTISLPVPTACSIFTDPPYGVAPAAPRSHFQGLYALDLAGSGPCAAALGRRFREAQRPGLRARRAHALRLRHGAVPRPGLRGRAFRSFSVGSGRVFARLDPGKPGGPDGMKVDGEGRVYVAVALGVWVFEPDGTLSGHHRNARAALEPGLVRPRRSRPGDHGRRRSLQGPLDHPGHLAAVYALTRRPGVCNHRPS